MTLKRYRQKRNFKITPEPSGKIKKRNQHLYIIQKHAASHLHYDFRLELNGVLLSWAVPKGPCLDPSIKRLAMHVEDHPLDYGNFEGIIPKGQYGGGTVMLWDKGQWISEDENPEQAYRKGNMTFTLKAKKLNGRWKLVRIQHNDKTWLLFKIKDEYSKPLSKYDITKRETDSVSSGKTMDEITESYEHVWGKHGKEKSNKPKLKANKVGKRKQHEIIKLNMKKSPFPKNIYAELATLVDEPPSGEDWVHEIKLDGYRLLSYKQKSNIRLMTRNNNNWTDKFLSVVKELEKLPVENIILDGEIVVLDKNQHSDFQLLQNSIKEHTGRSFIYYIFDLLYYDNFNTTKLPLIERKEILKKLMSNIESDVLRYSDHIEGSGKEVLKNACKLGLEGIVSKRVNSEYLQKRTQDWLKSKCTKRQEFIIVGFTPPQRSRQHFGSLLLASYNSKGQLVYNGHVGTGFTQASLKSTYAELQKNLVDKMPFKIAPAGSKHVSWVKPILVAEVEFSDWTNEDILRHPSFKGLRSDKPAKKITKEIEKPVKTISKKKVVTKSKSKVKKNHDFKLTHPTKIMYPEDKYTKEDIANYYEEIHELILPYITDRPLTLVRCPDGIDSCFFQKHLNESKAPGLHEIMIKEKNKSEKGIYIDDLEGLMALPQMGVLEIHTWGSLIKDIEHPDMIVFDLDPAPDLPWKKVVEAAFEIKKYMAGLKLKSFVKTTGGKGLHVVLPIRPEYKWDQVKEFAKTFVDFITGEHPDKYINKMTKSKRINKIFLDYHRNGRGATAVAPYSTRARPHAPVSVPLFWDELTNNYKDTFYTIKTLPERGKKDPWKDFFKIKQSLNLKR